MTSKMDKIRKAMEELNIKDNLVRISKDRFITVNTVNGEQTEIIIKITSNTYEGIVKELKKELNKKQVFLVRIISCSKSTFWYKGLEGLEMIDDRNEPIENRIFDYAPWVEAVEDTETCEILIKTVLWEQFMSEDKIAEK